MTRLLTFARSNAVGLVALLVALSGTAYAAALPRDSVGPVQLRPNAVSNGDVANGGIARADLADSAFTFVDGGMRTAGGEDPPALADAVTQGVASRTVVLPRRGRVLVTYSNPSLGLNCNPSGGSPKLGIYWDGVPVQGSGVNLPLLANPRGARSVAVMTGTAGSHEVVARWWCTSGNPSSSILSNDSAWTFLMS